MALAAMVGAQPTIEWQRCLGGSIHDFALSIQQTGVGGYIVAGYSKSNDGDVSVNHGYSDYWVVKLNASGSIEWQRSLGGSSSDWAYSIRQTFDGGYIVAGYSFSNDGDVSGNHGYVDYWVVKLNSVGEIEWQKSLGGSDEDKAYSIYQTSDSGYIVSGCSESNDGDVSGNHGAYDYWVVKLNSSGSIEWQRSLGGSGNDYAYSIQQTGDGGYIVAGYSYSNDGDVSGNNGASDYWVVKLNSSGSTEWQRSLGGSVNDYARSIQQTGDGGYIVAGYSFSNDGDVSGNNGASDYWVVKLNSSGSIEWQRSLGGSAHDEAYSIYQTSDSGYIVAGSSESNDGDVSGHHGTPGDSIDYWVVKLNSAGSIVWQRSLGGSDWDEAYSIHQTTDYGYIMAGFSNSNDGDISENHGDYDFWVVKFSPDDGISEGNEDLQPLVHTIGVFPNPFNTSCVITAPENAEIEIYDLRGNVVTLCSCQGRSIVPLDKGDRGDEGVYIWQPDEEISSGIYIIRATIKDNFTETRRIIYLK